MKKLTGVLVILLAAATLTGLTAAGQTGDTAGRQKTGGETVEISFSYKKQPGMASNQFAIWVEDETGNHIKTIYATAFTARGGFALRAESLPEWVAKSEINKLSKETVDSFTGATPAGGVLSYQWDFTDQNGDPVPAASYKILLEAARYRQDKAVYSAVVRKGAVSDAALRVTEQLTVSDGRNGDMISNVTVKYITG